METVVARDGNGLFKDMLVNSLSGDEKVPFSSQFLTLKEAVPLGVFGDNVLAIYKFGKNAAVGSSNEIIWDGMNGYNGWFSAPVSLEVVSDDTNDTILGSGARTMTVGGLDENWEIKTVDIDLNGTTPVALPGTWMRVFRAYVLTGGTDGIDTANAGDIEIREVGTPLNVAAKILEGNGQTLMLIYTIPAGYKGLILNADANCGKGDEGSVKFMARNGVGNSYPFVTKAERQVYENSFSRVYASARMVSEKIDIVMTAKNEISGAMRISGSFEILLVKQSFIDGL